MLQAQFEMQLHGLLQVKQQFFRKKRKTVKQKDQNCQILFLNLYFYLNSSGSCSDEFIVWGKMHLFLSQVLALFKLLIFSYLWAIKEWW